MSHPFLTSALISLLCACQSAKDSPGILSSDNGHECHVDRVAKAIAEDHLANNSIENLRYLRIRAGSSDLLNVSRRYVSFKANTALGYRYFTYQVEVDKKTCELLRGANGQYQWPIEFVSVRDCTEEAADSFAIASARDHVLSQNNFLGVASEGILDRLSGSEKIRRYEVQTIVNSDIGRIKFTTEVSVDRLQCDFTRDGDGQIIFPKIVSESVL